MSVSNGMSTASPHQPTRRLQVRNIFLAMSRLLVLASPAVWTSALAQSVPIPEIETGEIKTLPATDIDRIRVRDTQKPPDAPTNAATDGTCLLPPLNLTKPYIVASAQLRIPDKARKEYQAACAALHSKKNADAEKHLRKAVREHSQYAAAWVTLGQVLGAQQQAEGAYHACLQGSNADASYAPAYLCLADLAAREHAWDEVLRLSAKVLDVDPSGNFVAYEYHAAASLNLHNLVAAEKSALRALAVDLNHREPRVHFVLAQIYEAKGDTENETLQLRKYLEYADNPDDVAAVKEYLSHLDHPAPNAAPFDQLPERSSRALNWSATRRWGPPDVDEAVPPVLSQSPCPLPQILKETSRRTLDLIENLQTFSASERVEQIDIDKNGKRRNSIAQVGNYVAQVERNSSGYPRVQEYRSGATERRQGSVLDSGMAAFALIFHPTHIADFDFRCEGLTMLEGSPVWQVHFEESADLNKAFTALQIGHSIYLPRFKGRAWIASLTYDVMRIETDLVTPIPEIDLQREHIVIGYAPVEFQKRHVRLWLPQSTSLYIAYRGHRYERLHNFSQFQLFSIDSAEAIKEPKATEEKFQ